MIQMQRLFNRLVLGIGLLLSVLTGLSLLGRVAWPLDVLTHFSLQLTVGLFAGLVLGVALRLSLRPLLFMAAALTVNLLLVGGYFVPPVQAADDGRPLLRVVALNVYTENTDYIAISSFLRREEPDVVFVAEAEPAFVRHVQETLTDLYPYLYDESVRGTLGFALLSRTPFLETETIYMEHGRRRRFVTARIEWDGRAVTIWGVHPLPALGTRWAHSRNTELATLQALARDVDAPHIILGDFNAVPWSAPMRAWLSDTDLSVAARGHGIAPTWFLFGPLISAPLDYILVSPEWRTVDYRLGDDIQSDHRPVVARLRLTETPGD